MGISIAPFPSRIHQVKMKRERKVTVLLNESEYSAFESYCSERGCKKSTLLARLMKQHLAKENFPIPPDGTDTSGPTPPAPTIQP